MGQHINNLKIILLIIISVLISCKTVEYQKLGFEDYNQLILNNDGTFYQQIKSLTPTEQLYGNWRVNNDTIYLEVKKPAVYFIENTKATVKELIFGNEDSIYFKVRTKKCSSNFSDIFINNNNRSPILIISDSTKIFKIKKQKINEFYISASDCFAGVNHKIKDTTANYFKIEMLNQFDFSTKCDYITNPTVKYIKKRNKLIPIMYDSIRPEFALKRRFLRFNN